MSWVRMGSPCQFALPPNPRNDVCPIETCPGSQLYIYQEDKDRVVCCMCAFGSDFEGTEEQMLDHIEEHIKAGHHVRPSLRRPSP